VNAGVGPEQGIYFQKIAFAERIKNGLILNFDASFFILSNRSNNLRPLIDEDLSVNGLLREHE